MARQLSLRGSEDLMIEFIRGKALALAEKRGWEITNVEIDPATRSINLVGREITPEEATSFYEELLETCGAVIA